MYVILWKNTYIIHISKDTKLGKKSGNKVQFREATLFALKRLKSMFFEEIFLNGTTHITRNFFKNVLILAIEVIVLTYCM